MVALLTTVNGTSIVTESVWDSRFQYVAELEKMGAKITVNGSVAVIEGGHALTGADVKSTDLRAGAALVIAGLQADGLTLISRIEHIDRGYESIERDLGVLGAHVRRETGT